MKNWSHKRFEINHRSPIVRFNSRRACSFVIFSSVCAVRQQNVEIYTRIASCMFPIIFFQVMKIWSKTLTLQCCLHRDSRTFFFCFLSFSFEFVVYTLHITIACVGHVGLRTHTSRRCSVNVNICFMYLVWFVVHSNEPNRNRKCIIVVNRFSLIQFSL